MHPQQQQPQQQPQQQLRRFTDLLEALRHEYEGALAASATATAHPLPDPQYLTELALMQKTVRELEQAHVKAKQGFEEEVGRLTALCRQNEVDVGEVPTAAMIMAAAVPALAPPNLDGELTAGVLTSSFSGEPRRVVTPPIPAHHQQPQQQQQPQQLPQPQQAMANDAKKQQQSGWMAIYALPEQQRAVAVDLLQTVATEHVVCSVSFSHDGRYLAVGSNRAVYLFDAATGKRVAVLLDQGAVESTGRDAADLYMRSVQWSDDDQLVAAGAEDHFVRVWTVATQRLKHRLAGHTQDVYAVAFMPSSRMLASASGDRTVRLWDVVSGECRCQLTVNDHAGPNRDIGFTSLAVSDRLVVAGSLDKTVRVWSNNSPNAFDYSLTCTLEGHQDAVYSVALSADHRTIASSSLDRTVRLWRQQPQPQQQPQVIFTPLDTLAHHKDFCLSVSLSPDGRILASASKDRSVLLYTVDPAGKAQLQCSVQGHRNSVIACQFAGRVEAGERNFLMLASGSGDCRARIWRVDLL